MSGFKDGAASSGFGDDDDDETQEAPETEEPDLDETAGEVATEQVATSSTSGSEASLPWIYERSGIADGRPKTVQLHLQKSTVDEEHDAKSEIQDLLDESVKKADLREAAYLVGLSHTAEVAAKLREWGYDL